MAHAKVMITCPICGRYTNHKAKGHCLPCYTKHLRPKKAIKESRERYQEKKRAKREKRNTMILERVITVCEENTLSINAPQLYTYTELADLIKGRFKRRDIHAWAVAASMKFFNGLIDAIEVVPFGKYTAIEYTKRG